MGLQIVKNGKIRGWFIMLLITLFYVGTLGLAFISQPFLDAWEKLGPTLISFYVVNIGLYVGRKAVVDYGNRQNTYQPDQDFDNFKDFRGFPGRDIGGDITG